MADKDFMSDEVAQEKEPTEDVERFYTDSKVFCDSCFEKDQNITAKGFCVDCKDYLCSECVDIHKTLRATRGHILKDETDMPVSRNVNVKSIEICSEHKFEIVTHYCQSHDQVLCRLCKQIDHRICTEVQAIDDICLDSDTTEEIKQIKDQLERLKIEFKENINIAGDNRVKAEKYHLKVMKGVRAIRDKDLQMMSAIENTCETVRPHITALVNDLDIPDTNKRQKLLIMLKAKTKVNILETRLTAIKRDNTISRYRFVQSINSDVLGEIKKCPYTLEEIDVKTSSDKRDCSISDMERFSENSLIIADYNNCKIKVVDLSSRTVVSQLMIGVNPWCLANINDKLIAVTTYDKTNILVMSTSETTPVQKNINKRAFGYCRSIICTHDTLMVSYQDPDLIEKLDLNGVVKQTIDYKKKQAMVQFGSKMYMTQNPDENIFYLSDNDMGKVHKFTGDGKLLASFTHEFLKKPKGLTLDGNRIFVCGGKGYVFEISSDLSVGKIILDKKDGISTPYSVLYDDAQDRLFVGSCNRNTIQVFML